MTRRARRVVLVCAGLAVLGVATSLVLYAFQQNLVFFFSPSQIAANEVPRDRNFRIGGLVAEGSVARVPDSLVVGFTVTDGARSVPVRYSGLLPDMFREGKGVVAQGRLDAAGVFHADQVLAKHDENYMPVEAGEALRRAGHDPAGPASLAGGARR